jgi:acyl dehydratase
VNGRRTQSGLRGPASGGRSLGSCGTRLVPVIARYFEDYLPGSTSEHGPIRVDETEVVDFGRRFDPQPFHVDVDVAAAGPFGGLIASGWHTCALMMRLLAEEYLSPASSLGSPGVDELRWSLPVRPGDELTLRATVEEAQPSRSKPDRGIVKTRVELTNQAGDVVLRLLATNFIRRRPGAATG